MMGEWPRPCPIPGHPHDDGDTVVITESAWARLKRWHLHAPAERLPLPAVLLTWPAAWVMHWLQVPVRAVAWTAAAVTVVTWLAWARRNRRAQVRDLFLPTESAMVAAVVGRVGHRRCRVRSHCPAGPVADPDLPGGDCWRVLVATPS